MAKEKRKFTLWYYDALAVDNFGGVEEVELEVDTSIPLAKQSEVFISSILKESPTHKPVVGGEHWYRCDVISDWYVEAPTEENTVYTYYKGD